MTGHLEAIHEDGNELLAAAAIWLDTIWRPHRPARNYRGSARGGWRAIFRILAAPSDTYREVAGRTLGAISPEPGGLLSCSGNEGRRTFASHTASRATACFHPESRNQSPSEMLCNLDI